MTLGGDEVMMILLFDNVVGQGRVVLRCRRMMM